MPCGVRIARWKAAAVKAAGLQAPPRQSASKELTERRAFNRVLPVPPENGVGDVSISYLFESKGIQKYIFDSGRLADLVGASDLIAGLTRSDHDDLLEAVLDATGAKVEEARRAGGCVCLVAGDKPTLDRVRALWRLAVGLRVPGMPFTDCAPCADPNPLQAARATYSQQPGLRENEAAFLLPAGGPLTEFNPRTGRPAVARLRLGEDKLPVDAVAQAQRKRGAELATVGALDRLARAFLPEEDVIAEGYRFPRHFELTEASKTNPAFPFGALEDGAAPVDRRVAVVHADISGLGLLFRRITAAARDIGDVYAVAQAIENAVCRAARKASEDNLLPFSAEPGDRGYKELFGPKNQANPPDVKVVPARPIVLGGDDITVLARADLAVGFAEALLLGIERETAAAFKNLEVPDVPSHGLSACAGVAIVGAGHPFLAAHEMAEGLCHHAKKTAKAGGSMPYPSYLAFAVITSTVEEDFTSYRDREQFTRDPVPVDNGSLPERIPLNEGPYRVAEVAMPGPDLCNLRQLAEALAEGTGNGKLIAALGSLHSDRSASLRAWKRYWKVLGDDEEAERKVRAALDQCLAQETAEDATETLHSLIASLSYLNDALELIDIGAVKAVGAGEG